MRAVCQRCGADKPGPLVPCRSCTHVPVGEERTLAWLLSDHHLSPKELEEAARRLRGGEKLAPPEHLLDKARQGLEEAVPGRRRRPRPERSPSAGDKPEPAPGETRDEPTAAWTSAPSLTALLALDADGPPGGVLPRWAVATLAGASLLLTPLPAWIAWWLWRGTAPHAARQARRVALWCTVAFAAIWIGSMAAAWMPVLTGAPG